MPSLEPETPAGARVSVAELARGFLLIGLTGFGGVQASARRVIVEQRRWLSEADYAAVLGVGQALPGANTVNAAAIIGDRFQGAKGSVVAVCSLLFAPIALLVPIALLFDRFGQLADVKAALTGVAAAAAGMVIATGLKMVWRLKPDTTAALLAAGAFLAVAVLGAPLWATVLVLAPAGLALTFLRRAR